MGFFIDEETPVSTSSGGAPSGFFIDESPQPRPLQSGGQAITGGLLNLLSGATAGFGDEIVAGGTALTDVLPSWLGGSSSSIGDAYDQRLAQARELQSTFQSENPFSAGLGQIAGTLTMPIGSSVKLGDTLGKSALKLGAEGAGWGAAFGLGQGEGGVSNRLENALSGAEMGAIAGPLLGVPLLGAAKAASSIADNIPEWASSLNRKSLGARQGDYAKTANDLGMVDLPDGELQTLTKTALDDVLASGALGETRDPSKLLSNAKIQERKISSKIDTLIKSYEQNVPNPVFPKFDNARQYLELGSVPADKVDNYLARLNDLESAIKGKGSGSLSYLQQQKIAFGKLWDPNDTTLNGFNRAIYSDLQKSIEGVVPDVGALNAELQKYKIVKPILQRGVTGEESKDVASVVRQAIRTSGGFGVPILSGMMMGGSTGALGGLGVALAGEKLSSPIGKKITADVLRGAIPKLTSGTDVAARAVQGAPRLTSLGAGNRSETSQKTSEGKKQPTKSEARILPKTVSTSLKPTAAKPATQANFIDKAINRAEAKMIDQPPDMTKLVQAVIHQESRGNASAESPKGAKGLMQIMPDTAKEIAKELGITKYDLSDPATNKKFGEYYLTKMIKQFGDPELALAAYNAGPGNVAKWISRWGADWTEISKRLKAKGAYMETVHYVPGVISKMNKLKDVIEV